MRRLDGKVVLITGTAGGQGRAAALLFAAEGAIVVGTDVNADGAAETVESVRAAGGSMDSTHPLDLADEDGVEAWVDAAVAAHGGIDVVYNNAGATLFSPIAETPSAGSPDSAPVQARRELASGGGHEGPSTARRLDGGHQRLARRGGRRPWHPSQLHLPRHDPHPATEGDLLAHDHPMRAITRSIPLGRIGAPEEVARCALFLASDEASYVTAANLVVDGGWSAVLPDAA